MLSVYFSTAVMKLSIKIVRSFHMLLLSLLPVLATASGETVGKRAPDVDVYDPVQFVDI